jgi:GT2 family glycosyltransferase
MTPELVSVILVNRNAGELVDLVFPTVLRQSYPKLEVLVIDNGSDDDSVARIEQRYRDVRIVALGRNAGFSHALNAGIGLSNGEYVLSLNFDVVLEPDFVAVLVEALQRHPGVGYVAGAMRRLTKDGIVDAIDCNGHYLLPSRYCYGYDPDHPQPSDYDTPREVFGASACAALYRRRMLESIALDGEIFDEDLFAYFEDVDLDWRAQQLGFRCLFVPAARGAHMRGGTGLMQRPEVAALMLANRFLVMLKNDEVCDVLRDASPIARRTLADLRVHARQHPRSIFLAISRIFRLAPRMLRKRREIRRARRPHVYPLRQFRLPTRFLG